MKRKIIRIDETACNGCGQCSSGCPEGAIQIIEGKARLVSDILCDGLGACIGTCPRGAITIEEREAEEYDEAKVMENISKHGTETVKAHLKHLEECACPGSKAMDVDPSGTQLRNWPIQLQLINPRAPYFNGAHLVISADCAAFAHPDSQNRFLKDKVLINFCPKLDRSQELYIEKLTDLFKYNDIKSVTLVHMEVPCCYGLVQITEEALKNSGKNILVKDYTVSIKGGII